jgi:uncharacterized protein YbcV (DUF1398 family)
MFTLKAISEAHSKVRSGADFPKYIQDIKALGVMSFTTWVSDNHTDYQGSDNFQVSSEAKYKTLLIAEQTDKEGFTNNLKLHQRGESDYFTFCQHCAKAGIEKWIVVIEDMTCSYYDKEENSILEEVIPGAK